jgi:hypothetical protein
MDPANETFGSSTLRRVGMWSATATAFFAAVAFAVAVTTPPRTGPFAASATAISYPYSAADRFVPRDFIWMYLALAMMLAFVVMTACVRERSVGSRRLFGTVGLSLATASFTVIAVDYFIQLRTVQTSLVLGEADGLAVLSQYNPHGVFIALEELGFLVGGVSFCFLAMALGSSRLELVTAWVLLVSSALVIVAFVGLSAQFGLHIEYRFEVAAIAIVWLTLLVTAVLVALVFSKSTPGD